MLTKLDRIRPDDQPTRADGPVASPGKVASEIAACTGLLSGRAASPRLEGMPEASESQTR